MASQVIERELLDDYLFSSLSWCAVDWRSEPGLLGHALDCLRHLASCSYRNGQAGFMHLPLFLILDLVALATAGDRTCFVSDRPGGLAPGERALRLDYENLVLAAILQDLSFGTARERMGLAASQGPSSDIDAVCRLVEMLLRRIAHFYPTHVEINTIGLRSVSLPSAAEIGAGHLEDAAGRVAERGIDLGAGLQEFLSALITRMVWTDLLSGEDIFELEHRGVLNHEGLRIGCRQINEVANRLLAAQLPRVRVYEPAHDAFTDEHDESTYPRGGFSGLTNRGSFENLVRSELVYMESDQSLSLFDLRFVEGELLYYLRNEGILRRRRRRLHVYIDASAALFAKTPEHEYPFSTLTAGLVTQLVRDCARQFAEEAFGATITFVLAGAGELHAERVREESRLLALVLREEIHKGIAGVACVDALDFEALEQERALSVALVVSLDPEQGRGLLAGLEGVRDRRRGLSVQLLEIGPQTLDVSGLHLGLAGVSFADVSALRARLYARLLGATAHGTV
ncbi:MAG: hypothetical protein H0U74_19595 [Bradymonadaceae bacterium]|nr:hypothetical protein [Lujinxingiaceae bacterium]